MIFFQSNYTYDFAQPFKGQSLIIQVLFFHFENDKS